MSGKRLRRTGALVVALVIMLPALASGDSPMATTGNPTSITEHSAQLHGVIDPAYSDNAWAFEYSTASDYSVNPQVTKPQPAGSGTQAVSATITGLAADTTYYYRVVVYWQSSSGPPNHREGSTVGFTTLAPQPAQGYGRTSVPGGALQVRHGAALVKLSCKPGGAKRSLCLSKVTISAPAGKHHTLIACGTGKFGAWAPAARTVKVTLSRTCTTALRKARGHLRGSLHALFAGPQAAVTRSVSLVS